MLRSHLATSLVLATMICGCSGRVRTFPASGTVRFQDGQPVRVGVIEFRCPDTGLPARAKLDDHGAFRLGTFAVADGAAAGQYRVIIVQVFDAPPRKHVHTHRAHDEPEPDDDDARDGHQEPDARVARKFSDYSTSTLTATVRSDA